MWALLQVTLNGSGSEAVSPEAVGGALTGLVIAGLGLLRVRMEIRAKREALRGETQVPQVQKPPEREPTGPFAPINGCGLEHEMERLKYRQAEALVRRANWTIDEMRDELQKTARDHQMTAAALASERSAREDLHAQNEKLGSRVAELEKRTFRLESDLDASSAELAKARARIAELEADAEAEHRLDTAVTPVLPPRLPKLPPLPPLKAPKAPKI